MKKLMEIMAEELSSAFEKAGYNPEYGKVTVSNRPDLCEFQCNGAMAGAKAYKKAPFMIADDVVEYLKDSRVFSAAEVVKPGFINLKDKRRVPCRLSEGDGRGSEIFCCPGRKSQNDHY